MEKINKIKIYPNIDYSIKCPVCKIKMKNLEFVCNGIRNLSKCFCQVCKDEYFVDLPSGQSLYTPMSVNVRTKAVYGDSQPEWYKDPLVNGLNNKIYDMVKITKKTSYDSKSLILFNCLDYLFGHSLLKIFNLYSNEIDFKNCWVIAPMKFKKYIPKSIGKVWLVDIEIKKLSQWYENINQQINAELPKYESVFLAELQSHPEFKNDIFFEKSSLPVYQEKKEKRITLVYREDRTWGNGKLIQYLNLIRLIFIIKSRFKDYHISITGFGRSFSFFNLVDDLRVDVDVDEAPEDKWIKAWNESICVIGVHGSNLLLPSIYSYSVIELLPFDRFGNLLQDYFFSNQSVRESMFKYRIVYGNKYLSDVNPTIVFSVLKSVIEDKNNFYIIYP